MPPIRLRAPLVGSVLVSVRARQLRIPGWPRSCLPRAPPHLRICIVFAEWPVGVLKPRLSVDPSVRDGKYAGHPLVLRIIRIILYCRIIRKRIMCVGRPPSGTKCILCYPKISQDIVAYISGYCGICWYVGKIKCYQVWPLQSGARGIMYLS